MSGKNRTNFLLLLVIEALIVLALLPGCFGREELAASFTGEDISDPALQQQKTLQLQSARMTLTPGVYQVKIHTNLAEGQRMNVMMQCDLEYYKTVRNNGMVIGAGDDYEVFEIYVSDKVTSAYVECEFYDVSWEALVLLEVWKTRMGNWKLLFLAVFFFGVLDGMAVFRRRILEGKVTRKQQVVFWTLAGGTGLACFPFLTDYIYTGDDVSFHLARIAYLADALQQKGAIPIKIEGTWLCGHGYISPTFYSDLFLFIPALLKMIGFPILTVYKMFVLSVTIATAVISYHCFKKCVKDEYAALFGSLFYLLGPYRLFNIYWRGAVGEYLAMAFMPMVCCGMYLLYTQDVANREYRRYKWYIIWGMSAILQSHMISTEMTALFMAALCVIFWKKTFRRQTFRQLLEAVGIVLAVNAWFFLPVLYMMNCDVYQMHNLTSDMQLSGIRLGNFFQWLPHHQYKNIVRNDLWVGAGAVLLLGFYGLWARRKEKNITCRVLAIFSIAALVMSTAYFPWNALLQVPGIGYLAGSIQLPWRWMSPGLLFLSLLGAFLCARIRKEGGRLAKAAMGTLAGVVLLSAVFHGNRVVVDTLPFYLYNVENMGTFSAVGGEYLLPEVVISEIRYHKPVAEEGLIWSDYEKTGTNVSITLDNTTDSVRLLEIPLTGYKGYGIKELGGGPTPAITEERGAHGDLRIEVPAGYQGTIQIFYEGFILFRIAEAISLVSLAGLAVMSAAARLKKKSTAAPA